MNPKCKTCKDTGWVAASLGSDLSDQMAEMGIECEEACPDCETGRAYLDEAKQIVRTGQK
jgi:hypothetical protein